jgi:hypothetical protein
MANLLKKRMQNLITGAVMSFGKVQESLAQNVNGIENTISIQQEVQKQEIKLVKKERFYTLLDESNKYQKAIRNMSPENKKRFMELSEMTPFDNDDAIRIQKEIHELMMSGINENYDKFLEPTSFKNVRLGDFMEDINRPDPNAKHKFEADNELYKLSHYVKLNKTNVDNVVELDFYVNRIENPSIRFIDISNLTYFKVVEEGKTYSYNVTNYQGCITKPENYDTVYRFTATIEKNGEYDFDMEREDVVLDKYNTISNKNIKFNSSL